MAILSKACKPDNFQSHNSLKLSSTNIEVFVRISLEKNLSWNLALLTFLLYIEADLDDSLDSSNFSVRDSFTHMHGLTNCVKDALSFPWDFSNSADSYSCFRLALLHAGSYFFFLY